MFVWYYIGNVFIFSIKKLWYICKPQRTEEGSGSCETIVKGGGKVINMGGGEVRSVVLKQTY